MLEDTQTDVEAEVMVRPMIVDVYAYHENGDVLFTHAWKHDGEPRRKKGPIKVPKDAPATPIHFKLHDKTNGLNLTFKSPKEEAMWVDLNDCPTGKGNGGQIDYDSVTNSVLKVTDANAGGACVLHFALWFDGDPSDDGPPYQYDPEIRNGGHF